jgi:hypothetical protein
MTGTDASPPGYEPGSRGIEVSQVFSFGCCRIMARKELLMKRRLHFIFEVTVRLINPLQGYD